jgi:hypothetical protein
MDRYQILLGKKPPEPIPGRLSAYPNPFRTTIEIYFDVPEIMGKEMQDVEINVYDINGRVVSCLINGQYKAGHYSVAWDASGEAGLSSSMYIVEMKASGFNQRLKLFNDFYTVHRRNLK